MKLMLIETEDYAFEARLRERIERIVHATVTEVRLLLPSLTPQLTISIYPTVNVMSDLGIFGLAVDKNWIQWAFDPRKGDVALVERYLRVSLYHEAHHAVRLRTQPWNVSWIDNAVFEGLATAFERDFGGATDAYGTYDPAALAARATLLLRAPDVWRPQQRFPAEHPDGRQRLLYQVGTYVVDRAMQRNAGASAVSLVDVHASEIVRMAGFEVPVMAVPS
jgi:hypothetical protein